jgi:aspartyl protease family protein
MVEDKVNLVQGLLLLGFILTAFIIRKQYTNIPVLKYITYWLAIFLGLGILYSYKDVYFDIKDRFLYNLLPGYQVKKNDEIVVKRAQDGHYYLFGQINDNRIKFMVDTGASGVVVSKEVAKKVGIDINNLKFNYISYTANGEVRTARFAVAKFKVGNLVLYNFSIEVTEGELGISLLGMSFLEKLEYYKFDNDELYLKY